MLTWDQDLAYRRMLDIYYRTEKPLPADREQLYTALRANTPEQKQAVEFVLKKFWRKPAPHAKCYIQARAEREIKNYAKFIEKQSNAGKHSALARNARSTSVTTVVQPPLPLPLTTRPPYPPSVSAGADTGNPKNPPAPPVNGGIPSRVVYVERGGETLRVDMGKHQRLPPLDVMVGANIQQLSEYLTAKGFPCMLVTPDTPVEQTPDPIDYGK